LRKSLGIDQLRANLEYFLTNESENPN